MGNRIELGEKLVQILGSEFVYFQPPTGINMCYPCIIYSLENINNTFANNNVYRQTKTYRITVIDEDPDSEIPDKISKLPTCLYDRHYVADNLNHDVFLIQF